MAGGEEYKKSRSHEFNATRFVRHQLMSVYDAGRYGFKWYIATA